MVLINKKFGQNYSESTILIGWFWLIIKNMSLGGGVNTKRNRDASVMKTFQGGYPTLISIPHYIWNHHLEEICFFFALQWYSSPMAVQPQDRLHIFVGSLSLSATKSNRSHTSRYRIIRRSAWRCWCLNRSLKPGSSKVRLQDASSTALKINGWFAEK